MKENYFLIFLHNFFKRVQIQKYMLKSSQRLVNILLSHSLTIQQGEKVFIYAEDIHKWFVDLIIERLKILDAKAEVYLFNLEKRKELIEKNNIQELTSEKNNILKIMRKCSSMIEIASFSDPVYLNDVDPKKIAKFNNIITSEIINYRLGNRKGCPGMKWVLCEVPCKGQAELSGMSYENYQRYLYRATNRDWRKENILMQKIKEIFDNGEKVRIVVPGLTDFTFSLKDRGGYIEDGHINMPGGEVFYGPVEDSAEGYITFTAPIVRNAAIIKEIKLEFKKGRVVAMSAKKNQELLESLLRIPGADIIGEFAVGTNYKIKKYSKNISFDEKIGGTFHIALGNSYPFLLSQGGGLNKSALHWDIVCDLRKKGKNPGGKIFVDDVLVQKNGEWVFNMKKREEQFIPEGHVLSDEHV